MSSIHWHVSFLLFKTFKIQFHGVPPLFHYVLICNMRIHIPKITRSSLLRNTCFLNIKFAGFCYITYFVHSLIIIWSWSHGLSTLKKVLERFSSFKFYLIFLFLCLCFLFFFLGVGWGGGGGGILGHSLIAIKWIFLGVFSVTFTFWLSVQ